MWARALFLGWIAIVGVSGCGGHAPPAAAPVTAPASLTRLRINVHNAQRDRAEKEENVNLYTIFLRQAVEREFARAGYRVVVDPNQPFDVSAIVTLGDFPVTSDDNEQATASMTLRAADRVVDQVSAVVMLDEHKDIAESGPVALVDAVTRSPKIAEFAASFKPSDEPKPVQIAAPQ